MTAPRGRLDLPDSGRLGVAADVLLAIDPHVAPLERHAAVNRAHRTDSGFALGCAVSLTSGLLIRVCASGFDVDEVLHSMRANAAQVIM